MSLAQTPKPRLRGVSHLLAAIASLIAGAVLLSHAETPVARTAALVYSLSLFLLFSISAFYHLPTWSPEKRQRLRRLDHSAIYLLIAGSTTPFCALGLPATQRAPALVVIWSVAALGILKANLWTQAPRAVSAALYVGAGLLAAPFVPEISRHVQPSQVHLLAGGGAIYILGALIYSARRPNPFPLVFGYHEIFHVLVIIAGALHYVAILSLIRTMS